LENALFALLPIRRIADHQYENDGQHHGIFGYVLSAIVGQYMSESAHFGWYSLDCEIPALFSIFHAARVILEFPLKAERTRLRVDATICSPLGIRQEECFVLSSGTFWP